MNSTANQLQKQFAKVGRIFPKLPNGLNNVTLSTIQSTSQSIKSGS